MKCKECGSQNIMEGKLSTGTGGVIFSTIENQPKIPFTKKYSTLIAFACKDCGNILSIKLENPEKI